MGKSVEKVCEPDTECDLVGVDIVGDGEEVAPVPNRRRVEENRREGSLLLEENLWREMQSQQKSTFGEGPWV